MIFLSGASILKAMHKEIFLFERLKGALIFGQEHGFRGTVGDAKFAHLYINDAQCSVLMRKLHAARP